MVEQIKAWRASDDTVHSNRHDAVKHEAHTALMAVFNNSAIVATLLENTDKIVDALAAYKAELSPVAKVQMPERFA